MTRTIKEQPPEPPTPQSEELYLGTISRTYTISVITPIFGGGVQAGVNDPITLIRASAIRGHLRFWWRATRGAVCKTVKELRQREGEIWGTTNTSSPVTIQLEVPQWSQQRSPSDYYSFPQYGAEAYVLFPAQQGEQVLCKEGFSFSLTLRWLKHAKLQEMRNKENERRRKRNKEELPKDIKDITLDIEAAVWAWVNFGGIGARTRRGCGALLCSKTQPDISGIHPPSVDRFSHWLTEKTKQYQFPRLTSQEHRDWPTFFWTICLKTVGTDTLSSWKTAIELMKEFRQGKSYGRDPGSKTPGRSRWPEAESVRTLVSAQHGMKSRPTSWHSSDPRIPAPNFPRAEFGMPIIFELREENIPDPTSPKNWPPNLKPSLQPSQQTDRMASPIILRPIFFADKKIAAMVAVLNTNPMESVYLKPGKQDLITGISIPMNQIRDVTLSNYPDSPMGPPRKGSPHRSTNGSAVEAFLNFVTKERGFIQVTS